LNNILGKLSSKSEEFPDKIAFTFIKLSNWAKQRLHGNRSN